MTRPPTHLGMARAGAASILGRSMGALACTALVLTGVGAGPVSAQEQVEVVDVHTSASYFLSGYTPNGFPETGGAFNRGDEIRGVDGVAQAGKSLDLNTTPLDLGTEAAGSVDLAAGTVGVVSVISATTRTSAGYVSGSADSSAQVVDTITLSEPATVEFRGTFEGVTTSHVNDEVYAGYPRGSASFDAMFRSVEDDCSGEACEPVAVYGEVGIEGPYTLGDEGEPVGTAEARQPFSESIALPAGTTRLDLGMTAELSLVQYGYDDKILTSDARLDYGSTTTFEIVVPDGVVVSSGSGLLPIIGGAPPPQDTTAPSVTATVTPDPNAAGWHNGTEDVVVALTATDNAGGSGVQTITYDTDQPGTDPTTVQSDQATVTIDTEGVTTVTYSATDTAGNTSPEGSVTIRLDRTAPTLTMPAPITVQATDADGADVSFDAQAADNLDPAPALQCSPTSGSPFATGTTTVTCTATDAAGNHVEDQFTVTVTPTEVATPQQQVQAMRDYLATVPMRTSLKQPLDWQLQYVGQLIEREQTTSASLYLRLFEAQIILLDRYNLIPTSAATWLVQHSREARTNLAT